MQTILCRMYANHVKKLIRPAVCRPDFDNEQLSCRISADSRVLIIPLYTCMAVLLWYVNNYMWWRQIFVQRSPVLLCTSLIWASFCRKIWVNTGQRGRVGHVCLLLYFFYCSKIWLFLKGQSNWYDMFASSWEWVHAVVWYAYDRCINLHTYLLPYLLHGAESFLRS
jgi:hypothetical protein